MRPFLIRIPLPQALCDLVGRHDCDLPIYSYGVMLGISFIVGWQLALYLARRDRLPSDKVGRCLALSSLWALIGARTLYFIANPDRLHSPMDFFRVWNGGLVAYGGFLGGLVACIVYCRKLGIPFIALADCTAPALGIGLFFTRIGCFLYGCDYGRTADVPWAVQFPRNAPVWRHQLRMDLIDASAARSLPVHPTQIYESMLGLTLFGLLMLVRRYRRFSGEVFLVFFAVYGTVRSYFETLRVDDQRGGIGVFSTSQLIGLGSIPIAAMVYLWLWKRYRQSPQTARLWEPLPDADTRSKTN